MVHGSAEFLDRGFEPEFECDRSNTWLATQSMFCGGAAFGKAPERWNFSEAWCFARTPDII
eukprot:8094586-Alexandrium_andersonii.AAC.1